MNPICGCNKCASFDQMKTAESNYERAAAEYLATKQRYQTHLRTLAGGSSTGGARLRLVRGGAA